MKRNLVSANSIISVGYDANVKVLEVEFRDGSIVQYLDFSIDGYIELMLVDGFNEVYFSDHVRGKYTQNLVRQAKH